MKKFLTMIVAVVASMFVGMSTTSCGNDYDDTTLQNFSFAMTFTVNGEPISEEQLIEYFPKYKEIKNQAESVQMTEQEAHDGFEKMVDTYGDQLQTIVDSAKEEGTTMTVNIKMTGKTTNVCVGDKTWS